MGHTLLELLTVLVAAKLAAEVSERIGIPAVLGEIAAGILVGPSVLKLIHGSVESTDFLQLVGEIGVILLLLEVGMEMDLAELGRVGKASLAVGVVGVVIPFAGGWALLGLTGESTTTAIFLGAALTATSVGITARAFGDMKALATVEARVVIGAAVADDVLGLIILTVVARVAEKGSVEFGSVVAVTGMAFGFLLVATIVGLAIAPPVFNFIQRNAKAGGTMVALAFAFTLAFAEAASAANLAPIVGAFVAGLALSRSRQSERIQRELAPLSHIFVPVFFLEIGAQADIGSMIKPSVLGLAATMAVIAIAGKVVAGWAAVGTSSDRLLVGLGMIPRGEVGLIFATIGREAGVLNNDLYAALLLVVLVSTLITPPLLRWRIGTVRARIKASRAAATERPIGGWLGVTDGLVVLRGTPNDEDALHIALQAARLAASARPDAGLLDWFGAVDLSVTTWDDDAHQEFAELLRSGTPRSWRFLQAIGILEATMPEIAQAVARRRSDAGELDPARIYQWSTLERLSMLSRPGSMDREARNQFVLIEDHDLLLVSALAVDVADGAADPGEAARALASRVGRDVLGQEAVRRLVTDSALLRAAAMRPDALQPDQLLPLAAHIEQSQSARLLYLLSIAEGEMSEFQREQLDALHAELQDMLNDPSLAEGSMMNVVENRRRDAMAAADDLWDARRIATAPQALVMACSAQGLVDRVSLLDAGSPSRTFLRVAVSPTEPPTSDVNDLWRIDVATRDQTALLARVTGALAAIDLEVLDASAASWSDKAVLDSFVVRASSTPDPERLTQAIRTALRSPLSSDPVEGVTAEFDHLGSPWHTLCSMEAPDQPALLHSICTAFAAHGVRVESARVSTDGGIARDRFALSSRAGGKLDDSECDAVLASLTEGVAGVRSPSPLSRIGRLFVS